MEEKTGKLKSKSSAQCKMRLQSISDALYAIGGKWKLQIIVALLDGETRFNDLRRAISGISAKVLSSELRELELNGFVSREVLTGPPVVVNYQLTEYSNTLSKVLDALSDWGMRHREEVKKNLHEVSEN